MLRHQPFMRHDTFLGVCHSVGQDFGFSPTILRIILSLALFWNPALVLGGYAAAGLLIALLHWMVPGRADEETGVAAPAAPLPSEEPGVLVTAGPVELARAA